MYMGLNRVVSSIYGSTYRTGRGLCSVCVSFLKETAEDLRVPYHYGHYSTGSYSTGSIGSKGAQELPKGGLSLNV